jgi:tankyrase
MNFRSKENLTRLVHLLRERDGDTVALCEAVRWRLTDLVVQLLSEGIDPNSTNNDGVSPLMFCNYVKIGELLLGKGADVNAKDPLGRTPLLWFVLGLSTKNMAKAYVKWLLSVGADPDIVSNDGFSARLLAKEKYGIEI